MKFKHLVVALSLALPVTLGSASMAGASPAPSGGDGGYDTTTVLVRPAGGKFHVVDWTDPSARTTNSGKGGTSRASGCHTVKIVTTRHNLLGSVAYKFWTSTRSCWNRAQHKVSSVVNHWGITNIDSLHDWIGTVKPVQHHFYGWVPFYLRVYYAVHHKKLPAHGAYYYYRKGHLQNCAVVQVACFQKYPRIGIRSYSNGTYAWARHSK